MKIFKFTIADFLCKRIHTFLLLATQVLLLASCSSDDYINAVPCNSIGVVSIDIARAASQNKGDALQLRLLKSLLRLDDASDCGIDMTSKLYIFVSAEGNLGLVAKVSNAGNLDSWLNKLAKSGQCTQTTKRAGCRFSTIKNSWVAGFNSTAVVVMGPVIASQEATMRQQIIKHIGQDEDNGLKASPLFDRLDSIDAPIAIVTQAAALPDKFAAPFTIGVPKDADTSQILIAAGVTMNKSGCVEIDGNPFSLNKGIDKTMKQQLKTLRPITQRYLGSMSADDAMGTFMNVDGSKFIELLHSNKSFLALLAGINTAIDMDNIIKSIDGDMAIVMPQYGESCPSLRMSAKLGSREFLADVPYWKQSCPKGGNITDTGKDCYCYKDGSMTYVFGVSADNQYYSGGTIEQARLSIEAATKPLPQPVRNLIAGKRLCMVFNISVLFGGDSNAKALLPMLRPLFGETNTIIYSIK